MNYYYIHSDKSKFPINILKILDVKTKNVEQLNYLSCTVVAQEVRPIILKQNAVINYIVYN